MMFLCNTDTWIENDKVSKGGVVFARKITPYLQALIDNGLVSPAELVGGKPSAVTIHRDASPGISGVECIPCCDEA